MTPNNCKLNIHHLCPFENERDNINDKLDALISDARELKALVSDNQAELVKKLDILSDTVSSLVEIVKLIVKQ
jgi:hypothetical protein